MWFFLRIGFHYLQIGASRGRGFYNDFFSFFLLQMHVGAVARALHA